MKSLKNILDLTKTIVVLVMTAYVALVLMIGMVDPSCGPDGYSQTACIHEINNNLLTLFTNLFR